MDTMSLNYTYRAEWNPETGEYLARCLEFPGYFADAATAHGAIAELESLVHAAVAEMAEFDLTPPASLTDHRYSGRFLIRTSPALHARLTVEATEQGVSLNQWVVAKLAGRPVKTGFDLYDL